MIVILSFLNLKAGNGEDDQIIVLFSNPIHLNITAKTSVNNQITEVRMYNLQNPAQFNQVLAANQCNGTKSICKYYVPKSSLVTNAIYRITMKTSNSEQYYTIQFVYE